MSDRKTYATVPAVFADEAAKVVETGLGSVRFMSTASAGDVRGVMWSRRCSIGQIWDSSGAVWVNASDARYARVSS